MSTKKKIIGLVCLVATLLSGYLVSSSIKGFDLGLLVSRASGADTGLLKVSFLDIGQGDSIFITTPNGTQVLIDGGAGSKVLEELGRVMPFWDRSIDMIVATHPDSDHVGGLIEVLNTYEVESILEPDSGEVRADEKGGAALAFEVAQRAEQEKGAKALIARRGQVYVLDEGDENPGDEVTLSILWPDRELNAEVESNSISIVARLDYGETSFLLTGDAPAAVETYLLGLEDGQSWLEADVLKVGHHGSKTSTSKAFVQAVSPQYAVIQVGESNSYGHPHAEVIENLRDVEVLRTDTDGRVSFTSNGKDLILRK